MDREEDFERPVELYGNCNCAIYFLDDYLSGTMTPPQQEIISEHLSKCSSCRDLFAVLMQERSRRKRVI